jgi:hypothetical protein
VEFIIPLSGIQPEKITKEPPHHQRYATDEDEKYRDNPQFLKPVYTT